MTFYHQTIGRLTRELYPNEPLIQQVIKAKQFMDVHFAEAIDLERIATEAFYSKFHFIRCFKTLYGRTPYQYLIAVRIDRAKQLLEADGPVADVCYQVGFDSITSFVGLFKKMTGTTPTTYRKRKKQFSRIETPLQC